MRRLVILLVIAAVALSGCSNDLLTSPGEKTGGSVAMNGMLVDVDGHASMFSVQFEYDAISNLQEPDPSRVRFVAGPVASSQSWNNDTMALALDYIGPSLMNIAYTRREETQTIAGSISHLVETGDGAVLSWQVRLPDRIVPDGAAELGDVRSVTGQVRLVIYRDREQEVMTGTASVTVRGSKQLVAAAR